MDKGASAQRTHSATGTSAGDAAPNSLSKYQAEIANAIQSTGARGISVRGGGHFGPDAVDNAGGAVVKLNERLEAESAVRIDWEAATATVPAGLRLAQLIPRLLGNGWFLPVTPNSLDATIGGCVGADIASSNHLVTGGFGNQVLSIELIDGAGQRRVLRPEDSTSELFWTTLGGLGLTGVVTSATVRVVPVSTAWLMMDTTKGRDFEAILAAIEAAGTDYPYRSARLDPTATGAATGRGFVSMARHAAANELPSARRDCALKLDTDGVGGTSGLFSRLLRGTASACSSTRLNNEIWYRSTPPKRHNQLISFVDYFYGDGFYGDGPFYGSGPVPSDNGGLDRNRFDFDHHGANIGGGISNYHAGLLASVRSGNDSRTNGDHFAGRINRNPNWFRKALAVIGKADRIMEYRCAVPVNGSPVLRQALELLHQHRIPIIQATLQRFGAADPAPLGFAIPGWALKLRLATDSPDTGRVLDRIDEELVATGGRIELASDSRLRPELVEIMYPRYREWRKRRLELDPLERFQSNLSRRLGL